MAMEFERVHDVVIQGNTKTKDSVIEAEIGSLKDATTLQDLFQAATSVQSRLRSLKVFDSVIVTFSPGPPELPGTANVLVHVEELTNPLRAKLGVFTNQRDKSCSVEGSVGAKNVLGYGDLWDGSMAYGWKASEMSVGVNTPSRMRWFSPIGARLYVKSQDDDLLSSMKERSFGASINLLSSDNHDLSYNLAWRTLNDPSIKKQVEHNLLSSLNYSYKNDHRDSTVRPTTGYFLASSTCLGLSSLRQEFDARYARPLGLSGASLNVGVSAGIVFPCRNLKSSSSSPSSLLCDRYFLGDKSSRLGMLGFQSRPTTDRSEGADLGVAAFVDVSFDLPSKSLTDAGIYGHVFASARGLAQLAGDHSKSLTTSVGLGLVLPTKLVTVEANVCHTVKQHGHDSGKTGLEFNFSSTS